MPLRMMVVIDCLPRGNAFPEVPWCSAWSRIAWTPSKRATRPEVPKVISTHHTAP
jgi:hypothetical protein